MTPGTGAEPPDARAYRKFFVKQRSYRLRCGAATEMSLTSNKMGSAAAASAVKDASAGCEPAGGGAVGACPFCCVGALSSRLLFAAGPSGASVEDSRSCTKLAMALNRAVRAGVSGGARRRQHATLADGSPPRLGASDERASSIRLCRPPGAFSRRFRPRRESREGGTYRQPSGCRSGYPAGTRRRR